MDHYLWWTVLRWLEKRPEKRPFRWPAAQYGWRKPGGKTLRWQDGDVRPFEMVTLRVERFRQAWTTPPDFAQHIYGEPGAKLAWVCFAPLPLSQNSLLHNADNGANRDNNTAHRCLDRPRCPRRAT